MEADPKTQRSAMTPKTNFQFPLCITPFGAKSALFSPDSDFAAKSSTFNQVCQLAAKQNQRKNHQIWPPKRMMQLAHLSNLKSCFSGLSSSEICRFFFLGAA